MNKIDKHLKENEKKQNPKSLDRKTNLKSDLLHDFSGELYYDKDDLEDFILQIQTGKAEEITYLEPSVGDFSQNMIIFVDLAVGLRNKTHKYAHVCQVNEVMNYEFAKSGVKNVDRNKIEFVFVE